MTDPDTALPAATARLMKRVARFRSRRDTARRLGIPLPFRRWRRRALEAELKRRWTGGYVPNPAGDLVFLPQSLDFQALRILFGGPGAHPAALNFLPAGGVALDVGANLGEWTLPLARAAGAAGCVLAVEPNPPIAAALELSLRINNLAQARVVAAALSDRDGSAALVVGAANSGTTRLGDDEAGAIAVRTLTLDRLVADQRLARLDLVKLDVEGHERRVLDGAGESLARFHPALVIESGHESADDRAAIAARLDGFGYELMAVLHDAGALPAALADYRLRRGACAGAEAHDLLWLPRAG